MRDRMMPNIYKLPRAIYTQLFCIPIPKVRGSNPLGRTNPLKSYEFSADRPESSPGSRTNLDNLI